MVLSRKVEPSQTKGAERAGEFAAVMEVVLEHDGSSHDIRL
jgi:hypothetical protein